MQSVLEVNADNWEREILQAEGLVLVEFWHQRCPWCKMMEPIYSEVAEEYKAKLKFVKLNILESTENQKLTVKYGVMSTPTLVFFCDERPVETVVGFQPKGRLRQLLDDVIEKHQECLEKSTKL